MSVTAKFTTTLIANVEPSMKQYVEQRAEAEDISMSMVIRRLLSDAIAREQATHAGKETGDSEKFIRDLLRDSTAASAAQRFADETGSGPRQAE